MQKDGETYPTVAVPTPEGSLQVRVVLVGTQPVVVAMSETIPPIPIVRFHSSCVFGESFHAVDCDCGAQLDAARKLILAEGGFLIYAWEEGRGVGIVDKLRAISLQQTRDLTTAQAFASLGYPPEPRTFADHISALRMVFGGTRIKLASSNPLKISALEAAGYSVERIVLDVPMTPERKAYLEHKRDHLGHLRDD